MSNWFKFHSAIRNDPRLRRMAVEQRYAFVVLLSLASESDRQGILSGLNDDEIAFEVEMPLANWLTAKSQLLSRNLISLDNNGCISITDWDTKFASPDKPQSVPRISGWEALRIIVFERDNRTCVYCGSQSTPLHCDHIHPKSKGGSDDLENLVTACQFCNISKGTKSVEAWRNRK